MHYNARYYDPVVGRFISADTIIPNPANPQSLNRYAYVLNNPVRFTDPTGHTEEAPPDMLSFQGGLSRAHDECMADPACAPRPPSDPPWHPYRDRARGNGSMDSGILWSALADFMPILGDGKGVAEAITGKDAVTGEELPMWARALGFVGLSELRRLDLLRVGGGTATRGLDAAFQAPRISVNRHGQLTNGSYTLDSVGNAAHQTGNLGSGRSQFFSWVDSDSAVLDAAAYADEAGLWVSNKAKVFVENGHVGALSTTGEPTQWINLYRTDTGFVHGSPGTPP